MKIVIDSFLKGENLGGATSKTPATAIIKGVRWVEAKDVPYDLGDAEGVYQLEVTVGGKDYDWSPNKTSLRQIVAKYGDESDAWTGKEIGLYSVEQNAFGKVQQIIYAV